MKRENEAKQCKCEQVVNNEWFPMDLFVDAGQCPNADRTKPYWIIDSTALRLNPGKVRASGATLGFPLAVRVDLWAFAEALRINEPTPRPLHFADKMSISVPNA